MIIETLIFEISMNWPIAAVPLPRNAKILRATHAQKIGRRIEIVFSFEPEDAPEVARKFLLIKTGTPVDSRAQYLTTVYQSGEDYLFPSIGLIPFHLVLLPEETS